MDKSVFGYICLFSIIGSFILTISLFTWAFSNDYVLYEVYNASETLVDQSILNNDTLASISAVGDSYSGLSGYFDWGYVLLYVTFFLSTIIVAYFSREEDYFSFLNGLFWGTMFCLFLISIITTVSNWWVTDIMYQMIPNIEDSLIRFDWIHTNIGILSFIQIIICLFANRMHFRIQESIGKTGGNFEQEVV